MSILVYMVIISSIAIAENQNQFVYNGFHGSNLHLNGIAKIHPNGLLELTNTSYQQIGRAFFPFPIKFNTSSFSTTFVFAIVPKLPKLGGHGITFTISPSIEFFNRALANQYLGLFNITSNGHPTNRVFAIELDTMKNPEFEDIDDNHVGIDINSLQSYVSAPASYYSDKDKENKTLRLLSGKPVQLWIDYDERDMLLNVTMAPFGTQKPWLPLLSTNLNLSMSGSMHVGFSASTGSVPSDQYILWWSFNKSGQSQSLDYAKLPPPPPPRSRPRAKPDFQVAVPSVISCLLVITFIGTAYKMWIRRYEEIREDWEHEYGPHRFSYKDLYNATKGFKGRELLGIGGFGEVYKGVLPSSNEQVAIKRVSHSSKQGMKEFIAEIATMGRLRHRNLVQLLGYCRRKGELLLVYDFMANVKILKGVASSLVYLHEDWEQVVIHRDIKASNVLLDAQLNGRLGDFRLAKFYDHGSNPRTTRLVGTIGYIAPELARTGKPTTGSDVFAFGNLMLEIACGRKPFEPEKSPEEVIFDPRLEGNYVVEEMELILNLGLLCANPTQEIRPSMRKVMQYLDGNASLSNIFFDAATNSLITAHNQEFQA
ncbi:hypothetical protein ERO13_D13G232050v2 [Gossypium hirsutum]|nr:hypothetical protein ERO13_D13G232050v2 [Gossypium hirsutum]